MSEMLLFGFCVCTRTCHSTCVEVRRYLQEWVLPTMWVQEIKRRLSGLLVSPSAHWNYLASLTWHPKRHFINITTVSLGNSTVFLIFWLHMCVLCVYVCICVYVRASVCVCACACVCTHTYRGQRIALAVILHVPSIFCY